jgi:hypothetical protein
MTETGRQLLTRVTRFFEGGGIWWGVGISIVAAVGSLALAIAVVIAWPPDRFTRDQPPGNGHVVWRAIGLVAKNLGGVLLVLLGMVMALPGIPGQGFLTMLIGLTMIDFPGKKKLERRLLRHPRFLHAINRLRARFKRPPLEVD